MSLVRKREVSCCMMDLTNLRPSASCLAATMDRMLKARRASVTDSVPSAEFLRPVKGKISGPRWH